jgi:hypothetical protein
MRTIFGLVLGFGLVSACSEGSESGSPDGDGASSGKWETNEQRSPDVDRYVEAYCRDLARCLDPDYFRECNIDDRALFCGTGGGDTPIPDLDVCLKALATRDCDAGVLPECLRARNALRAGGTNRLLGEGDECGPSNVIRCDSNLFCDAEPNQCGTCRKLGNEGDACRDPSECSRSTYCANGTCTRRLAPGKPCDVFAFGCELGLICTDGICTEQSGEAIGAKLIGEACDNDTVCYSGTCEEGKCIARTPCGSGSEGDRCSSSPSCKKGYICGGDKRCIPALADGDECDPDASLCASGSRCFSGKCSPLLENGDGCDYTPSLYSPECASGFCGPSGKCGPHEIVCAEGP